jgi:dipeptidyl aminopeptidase/acylaminoacyl peptidase
MKKRTIEIPLTFECENQQIVGVLHLPKKKGGIPLVVLVHGWSANKLGTWNAFFVRAAREFSKNGFAVLRFDFRGSGDSEGKFEDQTITSMLKDLDAVITQVSEKFPQIDNKRVCLIGHSQGAYVSFLHAIKDERIKCLVSWMGRLSDLKEFWSKLWFDEIERKGYIYEWDYKITKKYVQDSLKYNLSKLSWRIKVPTLLIYGELDDIVPPSEGMKFYRKIKSPKKIVIVKYLNHTFSGEKAKKSVIRITLQWLRKWLKRLD